MGGVGFLLIKQKCRSALGKMELISQRIMKATFTGNPGTTIIETNVPTSELETESFYQDFRKAIDSKPQHNSLAILGDINAKLKTNSIQPFRRM